MLIGLNGFKGVGKDTVADYLVSKHGFEKRAFADPLKQAVANLFDISREDVDRYKDLDASVQVLGKPMSWRVFLQRFGTEMARETWGEDFWVDMAFRDYVKGSNIVFSDARFSNELRYIQVLGGINIQIVRPFYGSDGHASEIEPLPELIDYVVGNSRTIPDLYENVDWVLDDYHVELGG